MKKGALLGVLLFVSILVSGCAVAELAPKVLGDNESSTNISSRLLGLSDTNPRSNCGGEIPCNCGDILVSNHIMNYDLSNCSSNGIIIPSGVNSTTLDCDGHSITGTSLESSYGITSIDNSNNKIKNCIISNFEDGIYFRDSTSNTVENSSLNNNMKQGVRVRHSCYNHTIRNNLFFSNNFAGILLDDCNNDIPLENNNLIEYNEFFDNGLYGIQIHNSGKNYITDNFFHDNLNYGILLESGASTDNLFRGNTFNNNVISNAIEIDGATNNNWNNSLNGNSWSDFESNPGYPDYYEIYGPGDGVDWYPNEYDLDRDGIPDYRDNCIGYFNPSQTDFDDDGVGDSCDNCILTWNKYQKDTDGDGIGNACEGVEYECTVVSTGSSPIMAKLPSEQENQDCGGSGQPPCY